ncbi:hypothetical protein EGW08_001183 [Elysia chlorotica]|uniref:Uncharacterized protein n=1 Tax=Elysia chlorotica TaxID=188477 RepID=A0A433UB37_ELYCH|nr:hypothetical protein EGW08_001183 [Elysia chlorotica]
MDSKLHTAVRYGDEEAVEVSLKAGFDPNKIGLLKWNPIHEASHNGERDILKLLIQYKGDVNQQDTLHRNTPLHYAAKEDNSACVTVLLKAGARVDIKNKEGLTCLDVATSFCRDIIQDYVNQHSHPGEWRDDFNNNPGGKTGDLGSDAWGDVPRIPDTDAIGHLHLSFEYHNTNLKIRVWQVSELLLPPPQISMIESIFVRSYLIPDAAKKSNRKTEDVRVEMTNKKELPQKAALQSGIQHIFTPSSFKFETPLLYTGVTKTIVTERSVRLEVCMTQKHTKRAFLMAIVHMPLAVAVRRPIRERYPLIPCMNYTIPNNMRVYSARDIILENAGGGKPDSSSLEIYSRSNSTASSTHDGASSTASQKCVSLNLSDSDDDEADVAGILEIKAYSPGKLPPSPRHNPTVASITIPEEPDLAALREVVMGKDGFSKKDVSIDMREQEEQKSRVKKKIIPNEMFSKEQDISVSDEEPDVPGASKKISQPSPEHSPSVVLDIGHSQERETVVDIAKLQGDVIIEVSGDDSNASKLSNTQAPAGKKKILPPSELLSQTAQKLSEQNPTTTVEDSAESGCVYDDIASGKRNERQIIPLAVNPQTKDTTDKDANSGDSGNGDRNAKSLNPTVTVDNSLVVEDTSKLPGLSLAPRGRSGSEVSSEVGSAATSRPETPVWDFYDFTDEVPGGETEGKGEGVSGESGSKSGGDDASKALGTLQESILRLSRSTRLGAAVGSSDVLETERVSGPVLPTVMIEDFEEMEEAVEEDEGES